jgi:hypothetical protein
MSRHSGRVLVAVLDVDFSSTNINNSTYTQIGLKDPLGNSINTLPADIVRMDITNTASDGVLIAVGGAVGGSGTWNAACQIGQAVPTQESYAFLNKLQAVALKSIFTATLSAGKIYIAFYN